MAQSVVLIDSPCPMSLRPPFPAGPCPDDVASEADALRRLRHLKGDAVYAEQVRYLSDLARSGKEPAPGTRYDGWTPERLAALLAVLG